MFYSNNDNYMQDLYFYNQTPNNTYNPYMNNGMQGMNCPYNNIGNNMQNPNMGRMCQGQNPNMYNTNNINNLYPSLYRIINPVILKVIASNNFQFLNEDGINNMVDTVYNIVEGQIEYGDEPLTSSLNIKTDTTTNSSSNNTSQNNSRTTDSRQSNTTIQATNLRNNRNDSLLRDIIKILILKEILSRRQMPFSNNNPTPFYNMY